MTWGLPQWLRSSKYLKGHLQKEALTILGVGGTIEYVKDNETLKELPDKCVKALDMWVESLIKDE